MSDLRVKSGSLVVLPFALYGVLLVAPILPLLPWIIPAASWLVRRVVEAP